MFKFIRRKIIEGIIKDIVKELPKFKENAKLIIAEHKDEILEKVKVAIQKAVKEFIKEKLK